MAGAPRGRGSGVSAGQLLFAPWGERGIKFRAKGSKFVPNGSVLNAAVRAQIKPRRLVPDSVPPPEPPGGGPNLTEIPSVSLGRRQDSRYP